MPADNKWFSRIVLAAAVIEALDALDLHYPKVSKERLKELGAAKRTLLKKNSRAQAPIGLASRTLASRGVVFSQWIVR